MKGKIAYLVCIVMFCMAVAGCGQKIDKKEKAEAREEDLSMGGIGNHFADSYEPSSFEQSDIDSDTVQWICSAYSIYTHYNRKDLGYVGGASPDKREIYQLAIRTALEDGWGIKDRRSAISQI